MYNTEPNMLLMYLVFMFFFLFLIVSFFIFRKSTGNQSGFLTSATLVEIEMRFDPYGKVVPKTFLLFYGAFIPPMLTFYDYIGSSASLMLLTLVPIIGLTIFIRLRYGKTAADYQIFPILLSAGAFSCIEFVWVGITNTMLHSMMATLIFGWSSIHFVKALSTPASKEQIYSQFD